MSAPASAKRVIVLLGIIIVVGVMWTNYITQTESSRLQRETEQVRASLQDVKDILVDFQGTSKRDITLLQTKVDDILARTKATSATVETVLAQKTAAKDTVAAAVPVAGVIDNLTAKKEAATGVAAAAAAPPVAAGPLQCESGSVASCSCPGTAITGRNAVMCVHAGNDVVSASIAGSGVWELGLASKLNGLLLQYVNKSPRYWFVDAGANIGFFSMCAFVGVGVPVLSIEATPWNKKQLGQTRDHHVAHQESGARGEWKVVNIALADKQGDTLTFHGDNSNLGGSTAVKAENHPLATGGWGQGDQNHAEVDTDTLDNVIATQIPAGDCIVGMKIDIEGFEYFALQGASEWMKTRPPCYIQQEYHPILLKAASSADKNDQSHLKLGELVRSYGYTTDADLGEATIDVYWTLSPEAQAKSECKCS